MATGGQIASLAVASIMGKKAALSGIPGLSILALISLYIPAFPQ